MIILLKHIYCKYRYIQSNTHLTSSLHKSRVKVGGSSLNLHINVQVQSNRSHLDYIYIIDVQKNKINIVRHIYKMMIKC